MPTHLGHCFITWEDLRSELEDWAISSQFGFKAHKKGKSRAVYVCKHESSRYHWRLMASGNKNAEIEVKTLHSQHTCAGLGRGNQLRPISSLQTWLRRVVPQHLFVTKATKVQEVVGCI